MATPGNLTASNGSSTSVTCGQPIFEIEYTVMPNNQNKERKMATSSVKQKSAMDKLLDSFGEVIDSGAEKMDSTKLRESEKKFNEIADRVASRKRRRETA
jgi:hypothetical protein